MLGFNYLPPGTHADTRIFRKLTAVQDVGYQDWIKPKGASMIYILCIGGGGGGGGGFQRTAGNPGGGGGGGGSSCIGRFIFPAALLPDRLYVQVGSGGRGGPVSTAGGTGIGSSVVLSPTLFTATNILAGATTLNAVGGAGGLTGGAGAGGGAATTFGTGTTIDLIGFLSTSGGIAGTNGGAQTGAVGVAQPNLWSTVPLSGGAGGAGCTGVTNFAGGLVSSSINTHLTDFYYPAGTVLAGGASPGGNGLSGIQIWKPFLMSGGSGGASNNSGVAGAGGSGGIGCGGGGGGAGATAGVGGNGGDGIVIIIAW